MALAARCACLGGHRPDRWGQKTVWRAWMKCPRCDSKMLARGSPKWIWWCGGCGSTVIPNISAEKMYAQEEESANLRWEQINHGSTAARSKLSSLFP
jgi:ribosomal protein S27AE